jgi:hypothetical protein
MSSRIHRYLKIKQAVIIAFFLRRRLKRINRIFNLESGGGALLKNFASALCGRAVSQAFTR